MTKQRRGSTALLASWLLLLSVSLQCTTESKEPSKNSSTQKPLEKWSPPAPLQSRRAWNKAGEAAQDKAIAVIAKRLTEDFEHVHTKTYDCGGQSHRLATFRHKKSGLLLNLIPGGQYMMGSKLKSSEQPIHEVAIPPFLVAVFETTQEQWQKFSQSPLKFAQGSDQQSRGADNPVANVTRQEIQSWLARAAGGLRLLSESEWEYACRAGTTTQYYWGEDMDGSYCWHNANSDVHSHPVSAHKGKHNAFGLVDMSGNVSEFCADNVPTQFNYKKAGATHAPNAGEGFAQITRGGSCGQSADNCRSAARFSAVGRSPWNGTGFRVARSLD